jgi:hypothetical protein
MYFPVLVLVETPLDKLSTDSILPHAYTLTNKPNQKRRTQWQKTGSSYLKSD